MSGVGPVSGSIINLTSGFSSGDLQENSKESLQQWLVVVPARMASQRLPRKPLALLGGKPLILRVMENLNPLVKKGAEIVCATDESEIDDLVRASGFKSMLTSKDHDSGTDRCSEVANKSPQRFVLNVQGDEPFVNTEDLVSLCFRLQSQEHCSMGTLVYRSQRKEDFYDPNIVKVVINQENQAMYFSRAPIPYDREKGFSGDFLHHIGVYAFKREFLLQYGELKKKSKLETIEKLEQLRVIENGVKILVCHAHSRSHGIDTPDDLAKANERFLMSHKN